MEKQVIRWLPNISQKIFLTFDDGPDPVGTPKVLEVLSRHQAKATFFVIANRMQKHPELLLEIVGQGHAVGNHSTDHLYRHFFAGEKPIVNWIEQGNSALKAYGGSVGFRPPAGILTPPLRRAAQKLNEPLILWNERFFDAVLPWNESRARRSAQRLRPGSIILLHDRQSLKRVNSFCTSLDTYLACLKDRGLRSEALTRTLVQSARGDQ